MHGLRLRGLFRASANAVRAVSFCPVQTQTSFAAVLLGWDGSSHPGATLRHGTNGRGDSASCDPFTCDIGCATPHRAVGGKPNHLARGAERASESGPDTPSSKTWPARAVQRAQTNLTRLTRASNQFSPGRLAFADPSIAWNCQIPTNHCAKRFYRKPLSLDTRLQGRSSLATPLIV